MSNLSNIGNIKDILSRHGFTFSKALGQNFLVNPAVCPKMAEMGVSADSNGVIEVGPGIGVLTYELASLSPKVVAVELDKRLLPVLKETLADFDNIKVVNDDILKIDIKRLIDEEFDGKPVAVCANLPYYITSPVIMKLLEERLPITSLTVMVQKEAAERICAKPGTRSCGAVTLAVNYYSQPELLFKVSAGSFMPAPKVDSAVIRLNIRKSPPVQVADEKLLFSVIRSAFGQRRKTIPNSIGAGLSLPKATVIKALESVEIPLTARAEQLTMEQFGQITNALYNEIG